MGWGGLCMISINICLENKLKLGLNSVNRYWCDDLCRCKCERETRLMGIKP